MASMPCYVTGASLSSSKLERIVLIFTDVFGYDTGNHKLFADTLAARLGHDGSTAVLVPDLFRGNPIAQPLLNTFLPDLIGILATLPAFLYRLRFVYPPEVVERELSNLIFPWIQSQVPNLEEIGVSCAGFCFGGWVVARSLALNDIPMRCGVAVHPAFLPEMFHPGGNEDELMKKTGTKPILLLPAGNDSATIKVGGKHTKALAEARKISESAISVEYSSMKHGWVSRGNGNVPAIAECQEEAMKTIVKFLKENHSV